MNPHLEVLVNVVRNIGWLSWDRLAGPKQGVPRHWTEVKAGWLETELKRRGAIPADSRLDELHVESAYENIAFSSNMGLVQVGVTALHGERRSLALVGKFATRHSLTHRLYFNMGLFNRNELRFYEEIAPRLPIRTPKMYYSYYDDQTGNFCLLLEQLTGLRAARQVDGGSDEDAREALRAIAKLHAAFWQGRPGAMKIPPWIRKLLSFSPDVTHQTFCRWWRRRLLEHPDLFGPQERDILDAVCVNLIAFLEEHSPTTVCHGDFRLDNLCFFEGRSLEPAVIDWQGIHAGNPMLDVAYLLSMSFPPDLRRHNERQWLRLYYEELCRHGVNGYSLEDCEKDYARYTLLAPFIFISGEPYDTDRTREMGALLVRTGLKRGAQAAIDLGCSPSLEGLLNARIK